LAIYNRYEENSKITTKPNEFTAYKYRIYLQEIGVKTVMFLQ